MKTRICAAAAALALLAYAAPAADIRLKTRTLRTAEAARPAGVRALRGGPRHFVVQFAAWPGPEVRQELARRGIAVLQYVPDSALLVSAAELNLNGLDVTWAGPLEASDKLSPALVADLSGAYLVSLHPDADTRRARAAIAVLGFELRENSSLRPADLLALGPYGRLTQVAALDDVAYIMPASADLAAGHPVLACAGPLTEAGPVGEYVEVGRGWSKTDAGNVALKFFFESLTSKVDESAVRAEVERALREWTRYTNLTLSEGDVAAAARTIAIRFATRSHGDQYPFDGPGGILAHTYYPAPPNAEPIAGDMHLDADEDWHAGSNVDLFSVALHEAGHALGLGHSDRPGAVMYPYYRMAAGLSDDDIAGIRDLYGSNEYVPPQPPVLPPVEPPVTPPVTPPVMPPAAPPTPGDTTPPSLRIVSPGSTILWTSLTSLAIAGTAADNFAVVAVKWSVSTGVSGTAAGTSNWSATVPLLIGTNVVTVRAYDAAGNSGWRSITVVRR